MPKPTKTVASVRGASGAVTRIDDACRRAVSGKVAARDIAGWASPFGISETDFRVLWRLFTAEAGARPLRAGPELDQAELAAELAVSPAQVSAVVDRLRQANVIAAVPTEDRRRQVWRLAPAGRELLDAVVAAVASTPASCGKEAA
jgi:DNA-binding MarR family transcriptional regulator